jgi:hypothetical protein
MAEQIKGDKEEEFKRKEREMQAQMRQKEAKLRQVRNIFEGKTAVAGAVPSSSNHFGSTDSLNRVASQRFGGSTEVLSAKVQLRESVWCNNILFCRLRARSSLRGHWPVRRT